VSLGKNGLFSLTNKESDNALNNILLLYTHSLLLPTAFPVSDVAEALAFERRFKEAAHVQCQVRLSNLH
jgi:hypothetical protein